MSLKRLSILLLVLAVLNQTFSTIGTLVAFQMNRQYITEMLCVNKNRPELHCNGKCVLMQRVQDEVNKASEKGQQMLKNLIEREVVVFFESFGFKLPTQNTIETPLSTLNAVYLHYEPQSSLSDIFHPPTQG